MKKLMIILTAALIAGNMFAAPHGCGPGPHCPPPPPRHHYHHSHGSWWGRGGCNFWPSFIGAAVGSSIGTAITAPRTETVIVQQPVVATPVVTTPVVVQQPVVVQLKTQVWVEGCYVDQVQANGTIVRVWQPGHFEWR